MPDWTAYVRTHLRAKGLRPDAERDVVEDLAGQLEEAYQDARRRGLTEADPEAAACAHIADWQALSNDLAQSRRLAAPVLDRMERHLGDQATSGSRPAALLAGLLQDVRFALRMIRRAPGFTAVAVLTLALGIGANTTIFSWVNAVLLTPLPGADARGLVDVSAQSKTESYTSMSYPDFLDLRAETATLKGLAVHHLQAASLNTPDGANRVWVELVSDNFFDVLGVAVTGRAFRPDEGRTPVPVVVISERLWRGRFAANPDMIGAAIDVNGTPFTVVGIAPGTFASGYTGLALDVWMPVPMADRVMAGASRTAMRENHWLDAFARLKVGATPGQASAELTALTEQLATAQGAASDIRVDVVPLWRSPRGAQSVLGPVLMVLMSVVAIVLLIACANLANLLLSRASARRREFALRLSLGCGRRRLIRQLLTEAFVLVSIAAAAAVVAQIWTAGLLTSFVPPNDLPIQLVPHLDARVVLFASAAALASALIFGLAPALQAGRTDLAAALKSDGAHTGARRSWLRSTLVVSQVAFSLLLLVSAALFLRSLDNARHFDTGFKTDHMLLASLDLFSAGYDPARGTQALDRMLTEIRALPGVQSASLARRVPLGITTGSSSSTLEPEGYVASKDDQAWSFFNWVGSDYFRTMGIPIEAGREFTVGDRPDQPEVLVVNHTFAARYWPGQDPIGKRIRFTEQWYTVVGVVADSKYRRLNEPAAPFVYRGTTWSYRPDVVLHVRTTTDPGVLAEPVRAVVRGVDPKLPVFGVMTLEEHVRSASFQQRLAASLLSAFGALALVLASVGLYATMSYSVSRRTRELGARLAMGATRADIMRLVLRDAWRVTAIGVAIGLALSVGAAQLFSSLLVGVGPVDPATFAGVAILLSVIATLASYVPARRAAALDPLKALRYE